MDDKLKIKLHEILAKQHSMSILQANSDVKWREWAIAQLHQAFVEAGWAPSDVREKADQLFTDMQRLYKESEQTLISLKMARGYVYTKPDELTKVMTGQEWYDRFEKELRGKVFTCEAHSDVSVTKAVNKCMHAARKAAGLTPQDKGKGE